MLSSLPVVEVPEIFVPHRVMVLVVKTPALTRRPPALSSYVGAKLNET